MAAVRWRGRNSVTDELLIRQLFHDHGAALLAYATRLMGDRALGEDVVQETLIRAWRQPEALNNNKGAVRGWLFTITREIAADRHRVRAAEVAEPLRPPPAPPDHPGETAVLEAMEHLSREHRDVLRALHFQGNSIEEAARALGWPAGTVKSRSYDALRRLRDLIAERSATEPAPIGRLAG